MDLDFEEAAAVGLTNRAIDSFRFHHGGSASAAEVQLRSMLEDFLVSSARATRNGYVSMARDGYEVVLSPDLATITAYSTVHRERTWTQLQAGIRSRFGTGRLASGAAPIAGTGLRREQIAEAVDVETVHLTARARTSFAKIFRLRDLDDAELDVRIRSALSGIEAGQVNPHREGSVAEVVVGGLRWLVSDDGKTIVGVAPPKPEQSV